MLTGAPHVIYNIATNVDRTQFEPLVLFPMEGPIIDKFRAAGIPVTVIDIGDMEWARLHIPMIEAFCVTKGIDLIHANTLHGYPFVSAAKALNIPCFWYIHEMLISGAETAYQVAQSDFLPAFAAATRIGAVSASCRDELLSFCEQRQLSAPHIDVVHNGILLPQDPKPHVPRDRTELLSIGNLSVHKGYHFILDAIAKIRSAGRSVSWTALGQGDLFYMGRLWAQAEELGIEDCIRFLTPVSDLARYLEQADIVVIPSLVESFGLAVAEAMAWKKPVVATNVGGLREVMVNGETGLLVPPENSDALAEAIIKFIENPEFARHCGEKARKHVQENFTTKKQIGQLQEIYLSLMTNFQRANHCSSEEREIARIYALLSKGLILTNEKFHLIDEEFHQVDNDHMSHSREIEHLRALLESEAQHLRHLNQYLSNVEKDIRTLETVVNNLLQKLPFRVYAKVNRLFSKRK